MKSLRHVFSIVPDCHAQAGHFRTLWQRHFYEGLRGVVDKLTVPEGVDFDWMLSCRGSHTSAPPPQREETSAIILRQIQSVHARQGLDAVVSYCFSEDIHPDLVRQTVKLGIPWVNFFCDSTHCFARVEPLARVVSLNWFVEHAAIPSYRSLGVPFLCQPYAMNPDYLPDCSNNGGGRPAVFIGSPTANRITQLGWLRCFGCPVEVRGHGWIGAGDDPFRSPLTFSQRLIHLLSTRGIGEKILRRIFWPQVRAQARGPLADEETPAFLRQSLVMLGLNQGRDAEGRLASYLKFRDVEYPGYGCCYLTEHNEDITSIFDPGSEVLTYRTLFEAAALVRESQRNPGQARQIGLAARRRVLAEHTWAKRLTQLAAAL